jgi:DNA transposition AAA+ family ATPase
VTQAYAERRWALGDPTRLAPVDEADRLKTVGLEQVRAAFDVGDIGSVRIGMPGQEKRLARHPQFDSWIRLVHEHRSHGVSGLRPLLGRGWTPPGIRLAGMDATEEEAVAAIIRVTGGIYRSLDRFLTQAERVLEINRLERVTRAAVERRAKAW